MTDQSLFQSGEQRDALLAQRRQVTADASKRLSPRPRTETARDLLLHFDHAQIALRQVVVKRHGEMVQEPEHGILMLGEAIKQIAGCRLFASSFLADLRWRIRRVGLIAFGQDGGIACFPVGHLQGMQALATKDPGLLDSGFALGEQLFHLPGPGLLLLFVQKSQLA